MRFSESAIQGRTVVAAGGQTLGTVETLTIDSETWQVEALQVKLSSESADELRVYWNYFHAGHLDVPTDLVQSVSDVVLLSVTLDQLRQRHSAEAGATQPS
ncbi:MAG: PRC-barrel domain containing protein [Myxococcaceae bacterium]|nr:MAG: PRC-barrel domain containing protein [Myxococcaceae bacterium]